MEKSAIEQIQQSTTAQAVNDAIEKHAEIAPCVAIPDGFKLEKLTDESECINHYKGSMTTESLVDFSAYTKEFDQDGATCFIDTEQMQAKTFINLGTTTDPQKGDFTATLKLKKTSEHQAIINSNGRELSQARMAEFIEDWHHCVTCHKNDDKLTVIDTKQAIKAIRSITIKATAEKTHTQEDFKANRSAMESIGCDTENGLPEIIKFTCIPYTELQEREFHLRLSIITTAQEPQLKMRIVALEATEEEMAKELLEKIKTELSELKTKAFIGTFHP
jgi:uncharacterized protein YfdQ (DUF2303 family)